MRHICGNGEDEPVVLRDVCDYIQDKKKSHNSGLKDRILDYVHEHVTDTNLSLTDISLAFNMNPTYLSRFLKNKPEKTWSIMSIKAVSCWLSSCFGQRRLP
ncbi:hypothetical protein HMSSN036_49910 [Paenibacillus macerans]|nr:hypothetical protein HMSSN036_49910 [Paenibacillus macerans]